MKAKIRKTGEEVEIIRYGANGTYTDYLDSKGNLMRTEMNFYEQFETICEPTDQMTLRERYAGMALQGLCCHESIRQADPERVAEVCVTMADALIKKLSNSKED